MAATMRYVAAVAGKEKRFIKYPAVWLNKGGYLDEPESAVTNGAGLHTPSARDPKTFTAVDWQRRLDLYRQDGRWAAHWGPEPGQVDCLVPAALFDTMVQPAKPLNGAMR